MSEGDERSRLLPGEGGCSYGTERDSGVSLSGSYQSPSTSPSAVPHRGHAPGTEQEAKTQEQQNS